METLIRNVVNSFPLEHSLNQNIKLNISFVDDYSCLENFITGEKTEEYVINFWSGDVQRNGTVIFNDVNDSIQVLIAKQVFDRGPTWIGTIYHEMTHANDMYECCMKNGLGTFEELLNYQYYNSFIMWSEYHARKNGFSKVRSSYYSFANTEEERNSVEKELELVKNAFISLYEGDFETYRKTNDLMQILGRLAIFEDCFVDEADYFFGKLFEDVSDCRQKEIIRELYKACRENATVEMIIQNIEEFNEIVWRLMHLEEQ